MICLMLLFERLMPFDLFNIKLYLSQSGPIQIYLAINF